MITQYQEFRNPASSEDVFERAADFFRNVEMEDYDLCVGVQMNLNSGVYVHGPLHSEREEGVLYFKKLVQDELKKHWQEEVSEGHEIWPAKRVQQLHGAIPEQEKFSQDVCACGMKSRNECSDGA